MRRFGSAALDLCYTAAGFFEGYWEMNLNQWDVSAGELIVAESGCRLEHFRTDRRISVVAANPQLFDSLCSLLSTSPAK